MKLIVDKVEYKYIPVGPAYGTKGFHISFKEVEELSTTERGEGGFGSTGLTN